MFLILIFVSQVFAAQYVCDVTIDGKLVGSYVANSCNKPWPQPGSVHTRNTAKEALNAQMSQRGPARRTKKAAIKAQCAGASGLLKDMCDYL